jgi:predicted molibdopterin-dependent oxidoreductase YjgC
MTNSILELEGADVIIVSGSNTTETHPIIASTIRRAVKKGATLIVIDPRRTDMARLAHLHLRLRVGTDIALVNAMMNHIIREGMHNQAFIAEHTEGFETLAQHLASYTPEYGEKVTQIPASAIRTAASLYARARNASICYTMGVTQHTCGVNNVMSLANLVMLCGHIGRPSTGLNPLRGQNNVQGACDMGALPNVFTAYQRVGDPAVQEKFSRAWGVPLPDKPGITITEAFDRFGGQIKAFICFGENPAVSEPDVGHAQASMSKLEFMCVMDIFLTETAQMADVVLPCAAFAEVDGTVTNTERKVMRMRKAVEPPGQARPGWWILSELARRVGYDLNCRDARQIWDQEIAVLSPTMAGINYDLLERQACQWPKPTLEHPGTPYLHKDGNFTRGKGAFQVIAHTEPAESPDSDFPLWLTTGRRLQQYHTSTMTRRATGLNDILPEDRIEISPEDAKALGLKDGDEVMVRSRRGQVRTKAMITDRAPRGAVFMSFHFWEANANVLTHAALDPLCKIPEYKACAVRVERG